MVTPDRDYEALGDKHRILDMTDGYTHGTTALQLPSQDLNEIASFNIYVEKGETERASVPNWEDTDKWQFLDWRQLPFWLWTPVGQTLSRERSTSLVIKVSQIGLGGLKKIKKDREL